MRPLMLPTVVEKSSEHRSAVLRVELPSGDTDPIIQLVEVGRDDHGDRLVGRATDRDGACRLLARWLDGIAGRPGASGGGDVEVTEE